MTCTRCKKEVKTKPSEWIEARADKLARYGMVEIADIKAIIDYLDYQSKPFYCEECRKEAVE